MRVEESIQRVRVIPDAVVGRGLLLRAGQIVPAQVLGDHLEPLLSAGAVEWHATDEMKAETSH